MKKIAIIGAGLAGLACARECERLGVVPDVFERDAHVGWVWPSIMCWMNMFETRMGGDILKYLKDTNDLTIKPLSKWHSMIMKSAGQKMRVEGNLGYLIPRGSQDTYSLEWQLYSDLKKTAIHFNTPVDYKELSSSYDHVVVANAKDAPARSLNLWEDRGVVFIRGAIIIGEFKTDTTTLYFNADYICHGFMRITPFSPTRAMLGYYNIGSPEEEVDRLFEMFLDREGISKFEFIYKYKLPPFTMGKVSSFQLDNILLAGRAAGLTDRLMGCGGIESILSGIMAARAIIKGLDYNTLVKPLQDHVENISSFREPVNSLDNRGFDKLLTLLKTPGIKQAVYNSGINFIDTFGGILKNLQ